MVVWGHRLLLQRKSTDNSNTTFTETQKQRTKTTTTNNNDNSNDNINNDNDNDMHNMKSYHSYLIVWGHRLLLPALDHRPRGRGGRTAYVYCSNDSKHICVCIYIYIYTHMFDMMMWYVS